MSTAPLWVAVELRATLCVCACVRPDADLRPYARVGCRRCNGAGVVEPPKRPSVTPPAAQVEA